nr:M50 family metallopeptidase [Chitinophaga arvensicola]
MTRPFTLLFHELGHALPALLFTRQKTVIYLGSYGNTGKSISFRIGLLEIWIRFNLFTTGGLCLSSPSDMRVWQRTIFLLGGPLFSLVLGVTGSYLAFMLDSHGFIKLFLVIFTASAIFDFYFNLRPGNRPVLVHDGRITFNDGYYLKQLLWHRKYNEAVEEGIALFEAGNYKEAIVRLERQRTKSIGNPTIYAFLVAACINKEDYTKGQSYIEMKEIYCGLTSDDYCNRGIILATTEGFVTALDDLQKSLVLDPENVFALIYLGYVFNMLERYAEAIPLFDRALELTPEDGYGFNQRGLAKVKTGLPEEGLADILRALQLTPDHAYVHLHLGIYHLDKGAPEAALLSFNKAAELDGEIESLPALIATATANSTAIQGPGYK